ncbi:MAG: nucleotidyltransferase domain-containing protein, partial [Lentisphaerae bacterium]|nr:nucleotidyltransferase domain-containing protein [Lentisphaerota bacterium]
MNPVRKRHPRFRSGKRASAQVRRVPRTASDARRIPIVVPPGSEIGLEPGLIAGITDKIVRRFHPVRIVLFGSRARGDAHPDSDIDLFVEM